MSKRHTQFTEEVIEIEDKHLKIYLTSLLIIKMLIKTITKCYFHLPYWQKIF